MEATNSKMSDQSLRIQGTHEGLERRRVVIPQNLDPRFSAALISSRPQLLWL